MQQDPIVFRAAQADDIPVLSEMIKSLYLDLGDEDGYMTNEKISATFAHLFSGQTNLRMDVFVYDDSIAGYALLFDYWYNEFGGKVLQIDELFLHRNFRNKGIASHYIQKLSEHKAYVALMLEVLPENAHACYVYEKLGFERKETKLLYKIN